MAKDKLVVTENNYRYNIAWWLAEDDEIGAILGDGGKIDQIPKNAKAEDIEHYAATVVAGKTKGVEYDHDGFSWETKAFANAALKQIKAVLKKMAADRAKSIKLCSACGGCGWITEK